MSSPYRKPWYNKIKKNNPNTNTNTNEASCVDNLQTHGYIGYRLYFPDDSNSDHEKIKLNVSCFERYIEQNHSGYSLTEILTDRYFTIDYKVIITEEEILSAWTDFKDELVNYSEYCFNCMGLAMHQFIINYNEKKSQEQGENIMEDKDVPIIRARIINFEPVLQLKELRVNYYSKLVTIRGTVIKAGHAKVICQYMVFSCSLCSGTQIIKQIDGNYTVPTKCQTRGCRVQSNFIPMHMSPFNRTISWQNIKIQELLGTEQCENARIPRTLDCELMEDLVKSCIPGDDVTVTGILKVRDIASNNGKNKQNTVFNLYLEAVSICNNKKQTKGSYTASAGITFNTNDYYLIQKIHAEPMLFRLLVHSLCPNIYGHEIVKAGLLLALLGGTKSDSFRAESHVLMVGDPGLGKSQMLQACTNVAPRGIYVCGNTSTSSGLTVTLTRDSGEYALEAGALMLADQGCCCIDEFDKMPSQHACLLEAMEQQTISIAKAGIVCTLPTRATILAAANPAGGHYNKAKTIAENLKMGSPMLSRFDLIFIMLDQANEQLDSLLSKHVLGIHKGWKGEHSSSLNSFSTLNASLEEAETLKNRLQMNGEAIDYLPHNLFRKYIAYAQKYVNPKLSEDAKDILKTYYLSLRKQFQTGDCTPVTTRQLNSLIRLTQARAKAELREEATKEDAMDVIEIMKFSLIDIFTDDYGVMDKTRSQNGTGVSTKNEVVRLLKLIQRTSDMETKSIFTAKEIKELAERAGVAKEKFFTILQSLNIQGFLLNKGKNNYQLVTANV